MDLLEKFNEAMEQTKIRRARAMHSLQVEWKNLEHADTSTKRLLQDWCTDIQSRQEQLNKVQESVTNRNRELDEIETFKGLIEESFEEVKLKEKEIEGRERELDGKMKSVVEKEEGFEVKEKSIKIREIKLCKFTADCKLKMKNVAEKEKEVEIKVRSIENRKTELDRGLVEFNVKLKSVEEREKEVELKMKSVRHRESKLGMLEFDEKMKNLVEKEKEVELKAESNKNREDELDRSLDEIDLSAKNVREKEKEVELKLESIEIRETKLEKALVELDMKMKNVENMEEKFEVKRKSFEKEEKKLYEKKSSIRKRETALDCDLDECSVKKKNLKKMEKELALKERSFHNRQEELALRENRFEIRQRELEWALVEFDLQDRDKSFKPKEKKVDSIKISCEERCKKLELEEKKLEDQIKEFELKHKQFSNADHSVVKPEQWSGDGSYADIRFSITMDGKNLLLYLINRKMDLDSMTEEVYKALRLSLDPPKIVLNAMQDFYVIKEDKEFEEEKVCKSSILLLEQLRKISPHIQSYNKKAALELARKWKAKMKSSMEVIVFLQLLVSYKLGSSFEPEEFLSLFEVNDQPTQISELFQLLGNMGKISGPDLGPDAQGWRRNRKRRRTEPPVETSLNVPPPDFPSTTNAMS